MLRTVLIVLLILTGSYLNSVFAIDENYGAPQLRGNQIRKDSFSIVADTVYFNPALKPLQTTHSVRNLITFRIDESSMKKLPDEFGVTLEIKVIYRKQSGANTVLDSTGILYLRVDYKKNGPYNYRAIQTFTGGYEAKVEIRKVTPDANTNLAAIEDVLILENEIFVNRQYSFSCSANAIEAVSFDSDELSHTGELTINWGKDRAADEYDLEWTYIDDSSLADYRTNPTTYNANAIFFRNATRVSITSNQYRIPMLYDMKGLLFFRVRAVQVKPSGQRMEANWSSDYSGGLGLFAFDGHDRAFNWQASTSFAEDGKRKSVVQYFDGSLRSRQTVTKDNTTNRTIIAESFYDFQGRPVIQVLPSPSLDSMIRYTPRFNASINSAEYEKELYDKEFSLTDNCEMGAPPFDSASGAAQYYSGSNPLINTGMNQFIPKAKGYPFTEVRYLPDNTNRVSLQSGVGDVFQIGQHATRYYYGTAEQEELDALFGTEVGNSSHYFKNMVRDANGQYSVSYVDMLGRTIATALAGDAPGNMEKLASNKEVRVVKKLLDENNNIVKGTTIESSRSLLVPKEQAYIFRYSLIPDSLTILDCQNLPVCYDCRYDLEITITDECGSEPIVIRRDNVNLETNCNAIQAFPAVEESINLKEGNYLITKKLTINKAAMDYYRSVFLNRNTCKTKETFLDEQRAALASMVCEPDSVSCRVRLQDSTVYFNNYYNALGIPLEEHAMYEVAARASYQRELRACAALGERLNSTVRVREAMLLDVTPPFGQYARPDDVDQYSIFFQEHYFSPYKYQEASLIYRDEKGVTDAANNLSKADFVNNFKSTWSDTLLKLHPEYVRLRTYEFLDRLDNGWEARFQQTDTWQEAVARGYLNPANFSGLPTTANLAHNPAFADPIFSQNSTYKNALKSRLDWKAGPETLKLNAWSLATIMAHCKEGDTSCLSSFKSVNQAFELGPDCSGELDFAWRYFREFYLQTRREMIQAIVFQSSGNIQLDGSKYFIHFNNTPPTGSELEYPGSKEEAEVLFNAQIDSNCRALSVQWIEDLKPCNLTENQRNEIISRMIQVCKEGGDPQHVFGASTVKPSSTNLDRSFEQVMKDVLGANYNSNCNVYLINSPKPYGVQAVLGEKEIYSKPDSCECSTISGLYGNYSLRKLGGETFSDYIYRTSGTRVNQGVLDTLRMACSGEIDCNFLKEPIILPPVLQCGVKDVCIDCYAMDTLYTGFRKAFPGIVPAWNEDDSLQRSRNKLFENYMNHHLGFGKSAIEYLTFMDSCKIAYGLIDTLDLIQQSFRNNRQQTYGVTTNYSTSGTENYSDLHDLVSDGVILLPDSIRQRIGGSTHAITISQKSPATWCWQNGFAIEGKFKFLKYTGYETGFWMNAGNNVQMQFALYRDSFTHKGLSYGPGLYLSGIRDTSGTGYGAVFGGNGFEYKRLSRDSNALQNWNVFKLVIRPGYYDLYWNGELIHHTVCSPSLILYNSSQFVLGLPGGQGCLDYIRFSDVSAVRYYEEYENADLPAIANAEYFCPATVPDCETSFTQYFNQQRGTNHNYDQISAIYGAAGLSLNACTNTSGITRNDTLLNWLKDYRKYGGIPHFDASGSDTTKWRPNFGGSIYKLGVPLVEVIRNGVLKLPKFYTDTTRGKYSAVDFDYYDTLCMPAEGFDFEYRIKLPDSLVVPNFYKAIFWTTMYPVPPGNYVQTSYAYGGGQSGICLDDTVSFSCIGYNLPAQSFNEWRTLKHEFRGNRFRYYLDTILLAERIMNAPFTSFKYFTFNPKSLMAEVDYFRFVDINGRMLYNEEFNDPYDLAIPDRSLKCGGCELDFTKYFNQRNGTQLTYAAIIAQYRQYGITETPCPRAGIKLCGRSEPAFPPMMPQQHQPCDDSTMFAFSAATILHDFYKDSVVSSFDDRYLAKCLEVKNTEQFTVEHNINEYHYTLYYYDLAGNLVKTIPPEGVNVSKFQWAANWSDSVRLARKNNVLLAPDHKLPTDYRYNTLNQVVEQKSPDGGRSEFYYDRLGRLALSQNAKQRNDLTPGFEDWAYSYTRYDDLGRITEVGEVKNQQNQEVITREMVRDKNMLDQWHLELIGRRSQITSTLYDFPYEGTGGEDLGVIIQKNLRNRVSATFYSEGANQSLYNSATFYTYDIHGNVDKLLQDYGLSGFVPNVMNMNGNRFKLIEYDYDLISGKVNSVAYQKGWADQFYHRYKYDAENRLTLVETSLDGFVWQKDARYEYYLHGPLARTVLGDQSVQGVDYAYTLQGWLKGVNSTGATREHDMGGDGKSTSINKYTARDAYGFNLNYFTGDYQPSSVNVNPFPGYSAMLGARYRPLYNGNISSMATAIRRFEDRGTYENGPNLFFNYKYDQLNRIVSLDTDTGFNMASNSYPMLNSLPGFKERFSYDANGNILSLRRNNKGAAPIMDVLTYSYYPGTNQLKHVGDSVPADNWGSQIWDPIVDIDNQAYANNYEYDPIGNLRRDSSEGIYNIKWNVYGKIQEINKYPTPRSSTTKIKYTYDASGNRISKVVEEGTSKRIHTWYVRDAQGNVMSVYKAEGTASNLGALSLDQTERYMYGISRLGVERKSQNVDGGPWNAGAYYSNGLFERGRRQYELTNHLGNVLTTITDKKFGVSSNGTTIDYFEPEMVTGMDYYAFGSPMRVAGEGAYRFGFNGKENDNEVKGGDGLQQDYGMRVYDNRLGRFLSVDPLTKGYPMLTPYQFASGNPIAGVDEDGLEFRYYSLKREPGADLKSHLTLDKSIKVVDRVIKGTANISLQSNIAGEIKNWDRSFNFKMSEVGLNPTVVSPDGKTWRVVPDNFDLTDLPELNDPVWSTLETPDEFLQNKMAEAENFANKATSFASAINLVTVGFGKVKQPRYEGAKPKYHVNEKHVKLRKGQKATALPDDAEDVFKTAVPDDPKKPKHWYGKNKDGSIYRYSSSNDGNAHFSGRSDEGDGIKSISDYAKERLKDLGNK